MNDKLKTLPLLFFTLLFTMPTHAIRMENGVSEQLAQYRAKHVHNVEYELMFVIPDTKTQKVTFFETLTFDWTGSQDLHIDFHGASFDGKATINGKKRELRWENEHIVVPRRWLKMHNVIVLQGESEDKSLNRNEDFLYTLFVPDHARSVFPCFDQPDLKARFSLRLSVPYEWKAIGNAPMEKHDSLTLGCKWSEIYKFQKTLPIPTYLFSFVAGNFQSKQTERDGRIMTALLRETDSTKVAQLGQVFDEIAYSLRWLENYTGIPYPFSKLDIAILPGYQFGGMEHPGAIQFNARTIFLGDNPTPDELLKRTELIAHEIAHMWFGDLVTMQWFDDVWTKEVFANFIAAKISRELYPDINHDLNFLKAYQVPALAVDRTDGTHPIQQPLANLNQAGLLYGNIIYDKAPVMMRKLEQQIGEKPLQQGLQTYLTRFSFNNATWDDLIGILDSVAPQADLRTFSHVWVKEKGLPVITMQTDNGKLLIHQIDPYGRGLLWQQQFKIGVLHNGAVTELTFETEQAQEEVPFDIGNNADALFLNYDGNGYGQFLTNDQKQIESLFNWFSLPETNRFAAMMTLYENYLAHKIEAKTTYNAIYKGFLLEKNELIASSCVNYMTAIMNDMPHEMRTEAEESLYKQCMNHPLASIRQKLLRHLSTSATHPAVLDSLFQIWHTKSEPLLNEQDYMTMSYHLAIMLPDRWHKIIDTQRNRLTNVDDQHEFDFVSRACNPDENIQQELFQTLLIKENRAIEPWAKKLLALLNHPAREPFSNGYLVPALDALPEIQQTGDIFFPGYWLNALIDGHQSEEAKNIVDDWIETHPDLPEALMNKLKQASWHLRNIWER